MSTPDPGVDDEQILDLLNDEIRIANTAEDQGDNDVPQALTMLARNSRPPLTTLFLEYTTVLPDYPQTHPDGYTYCINLQGEEQAGKWTIQYGHRIRYPANRTRIPFLGNTFGMKSHLQCTGVKVCEYVSNTLRNLHHTTTSEELWEQIRGSRTGIDLTEPDLRKRYSNTLYLAAQKKFNAKTACTNQGDSCKLLFQLSHYLDVAGIYNPYFRCSNSTPETRSKHFFKAIATDGRYNIDHLCELVNEGQAQDHPSEECGVIEGNQTRRPTCNVDHYQGQAVPYMLFTSYGTHTHPPPPPSKAPTKLCDEVIRLIKRTRDAKLTLAKFMQSEALRDFCLQYNKASLAEVHQSFGNMDRISALIRKERLLLNPHGTHFQGVVFEKGIHHSIFDSRNCIHPRDF
ncbi:hypothetical protein P152DRAFT_256707 [Eremomyces bilateralis CBS 781.70]|uniref:Helitron helicase-like domain-containing protein n=1 Tax=Eremomyces bilateralis CBS 781.70 TaxID=1392243 RepID=A0A6G1FQX8_9PEZI|nr:uncharacterized protein P152DRAFT_256707 [Eremomyces bilateralis CBS 781.70]KAF1808089.1 hypothetical protein P152DRAFT_256707 [Eremomyces bilateralis CBS 781.70]